MKDFKGKIAVITGAGRGMGRGIALHCAKKGMKIVLADIRSQGIPETIPPNTRCYSETGREYCQRA